MHRETGVIRVNSEINESIQLLCACMWIGVKSANKCDMRLITVCMCMRLYWTMLACVCASNVRTRTEISVFASESIKVFYWSSHSVYMKNKLLSGLLLTFFLLLSPSVFLSLPFICIDFHFAIWFACWSDCYVAVIHLLKRYFFGRYKIRIKEKNFFKITITRKAECPDLLLFLFSHFFLLITVASHFVRFFVHHLLLLLNTRLSLSI